MGLISAIKVMLTVLSIPSYGATMRKMSVLELLFALLLVCLVAGVGFVAALVWGLVKRTEGHARDVAELRTSLQAGGPAQENQAAEPPERLSNTPSTLGSLQTA